MPGTCPYLTPSGHEEEAEWERRDPDTGTIALRCESTLATSGEITLGEVAGGRVDGIEALLMTGMNCEADTVRISVSVAGSSFRGVSAIAEPSALPIDKASSLRDSFGFAMTEDGAWLSSASGEVFLNGSCDGAAGKLESSTWL